MYAATPFSNLCGPILDANKKVCMVVYVVGVGGKEEWGSIDLAGYMVLRAISIINPFSQYKKILKRIHMKMRKTAYMGS